MKNEENIYLVVHLLAVRFIFFGGQQASQNSNLFSLEMVGESRCFFVQADKRFSRAELMSSFCPSHHNIILVLILKTVVLVGAFCGLTLSAERNRCEAQTIKLDPLGCFWKG